jgi:trans-2,3-dihydro-3-hydroxyanthranilate isomerase
MDRWEFRIVDVFTNRPLAGNQLAVFEDATGIPEALLQPLAKEIGYAETVFSYPPPPGADAGMRIFTPEAEIKFAGHPTLGTAVLTGARLGKDRVVLQTGMGPVPVRLETSPGAATRGTMEQPIPTATPYPAVDELLRAVGVAASILPVTLYDNGIPHVYITLETPGEVAALSPDLAALSRLARGTSLPTVGFNVFAGSGREWKTRMFAPADGVPEDAATGSAAGPLALHLSRHGVIPWGEEIRVIQGVEIGRPSELFVRVTGNADSVERIEVGGSAVPVGGGWFDSDVLQRQLSDKAR